MKYIQIQTYDNYIESHMARGILESENISCWLKDENTVTIDPILTNAVGGIKLMVATSQVDRAKELLDITNKHFKQTNPCPNCGGTDVEYVSTPRKASNWFTTIFSLILNGGSPMPVKKVYHCFTCGHEYES